MKGRRDMPEVGVKLVAFAVIAALGLVIRPSVAVGEQVITEPLRLEADADWTGTGPVSVVSGGSVDLAGHQLQVDGFADLSSLQVDVTSPEGTVSSPTEIYSGSAAFLFDNNFTFSFNTTDYTNPEKNHRICVQRSSFPFVVNYDLGEGNAKCVRSYKIYFDSVMSNAERAPKNWTFAGSNDGEDWTVLDVHSDYTDWKPKCVRLFEFSNATAYRHYQLTVSDVVSRDYLEFYQLEYFEASSGTVDLTLPTTNRASCTKEVYSGKVEFLFDNKFWHTASSSSATDPELNHRLCINGKLPASIDYDFGEGTAYRVNGYRIWYDGLGASCDWERAPRDWTFEGSNDKENWTVLDRRFGYTNWVRNAKCNREFAFVNTNAYRHCRLTVTDVGKGSVLELFQLEYFARPAVWSTASDLGADLTVPGGEDTAKSSTPFHGSVSHLFDNDFTYVYNSSHPEKDHRLLAKTDQASFDIVYDFGEGTPAAVNAYKIHYQNAGKDQGRHPRNWTFLGSNDGSVWTLIDQRTNEGDWPTPLPSVRAFEFVNSMPYRYYKLTLAKGQQYTEFYQLEFFRKPDTGELHVVVPQGAASTNDVVSVDAGVKLVKDGTGTFVCAKGAQTHGSTEVRAGTLVAALDGEKAPCGFGDPAISGSGVTVDAGATFDLGGFGNWGRLPMTLAGGTLVAAMPTNAPVETLRYVTLTADSRLEIAGALSMTGEGRFDLGAKTLAAAYADGAIWTNRLSIVGGGTIAFEVLKGWNRCVLAWDSIPSATTVTKAPAGRFEVEPRADGVYTLPRGALILIR